MWAIQIIIVYIIMILLCFRLEQFSQFVGYV